MTQDRRSSIISNVTVDRIDKYAVKIRWETGIKDLGVSIFVGDSPVTIDGSSPAARVPGGTCAQISGLDPHVRHYFKVAPDGAPGVIAGERRVYLEGAVNFRDLGGYETRDGHRVKWGQVFRSDSLARLTHADQSLLRRMGLRLVCDFRSPAELEIWPDRLPEGGSVEYLHLPITHGEFDFVAALERIRDGDDSWLTDGFMVNGYIGSIEEFADTWGTVLNRLAEQEGRPMVFHCTGGKDRAGTCAALILLALGLPEETVIYDHQLSNVLIANLVTKLYKRIESYGVDPEKLAPYFTAPRECIVSLIDHIHETYGSPTNYLRTKAGVSEETLALLKQRLLE